MSASCSARDDDYGRSRPGTPISAGSGSDADVAPNDLSSVLSPDHLEMLELCRSWKQELEIDENGSSEGAHPVSDFQSASEFLLSKPEHTSVFETFKEAAETQLNLKHSPEPDPEVGVEHAPAASPPAGRSSHCKPTSSPGPASMPAASWSPTPSTRGSAGIFGSPASPPSPRSPRMPLTPEQQQREHLQLRQAEIELELSPTGKEALVACQVSPTSWLHITQRAANEFQTVNNIVKDTRQLVQQQAAFDIEKHRHQVAAYLGSKIGMVSFMHLLEMSEKPWREPLCSLAKEALESLVNSQYIEGVTLMMLRAACYPRKPDTQLAAIKPVSYTHLTLPTKRIV
eukprot:TRINITY_DN15594_c0_g1_i1.p1 TRINITY_DN15594_c0_g1~~TRINITY_DN15594_c0_g1_i1.p1  ORF type:complete len:343 (-),score=54.96 TRINITY_DN15594_c0_g1_i1:91-1119(-)